MSSLILTGDVLIQQCLPYVSRLGTAGQQCASADAPFVLVARQRVNCKTSEQHDETNEAAEQRSPKVSPYEVIGRINEYKRTNSGRTDVIAEDNSSKSKNDADSKRVSVTPF